MASDVAAYSGINSLSRSSGYASDPSGSSSGASMPTKVTGSSGSRSFHVELATQMPIIARAESARLPGFGDAAAIPAMFLPRPLTSRSSTRSAWSG